MEFSIEAEQNVKVIHLTGSLISEYDSQGLLDEIAHCIEQGQSKFVIDLASLSSLNSSGLGVLINILTKARKAGGDAVIINVSETINKLLIITKLNSVFNFSGDLETAIKQLEN